MAASPLLIDALNGILTPRVHFWFMRQAGRYLPEYKQVRSTTSGFLDLCFTPEKAAEVTLQPLRRFGMDAAILFSDILVIPYGLGVDVTFVEGEGPRVAVCTSDHAIDALDLTAVQGKLAPVAQTVRLVKKQLADDLALIGFAGAPWTVACYMLQGKSGKEFQDARLFAVSHPERMQRLINTLTLATIDYLRMQIEAGADAIQIFDSWAGLLTPEEFAVWVIAPTQKIVAALRHSHSHIPIIGFAKGAGTQLAVYAKKTNVNAIGVDQHMPMHEAIAMRAHAKQAVQGNLDPLLMAGNKEAALEQTDVILETFKTTPAIFNLGHGFIPQTPIETVAAVAAKVKAWRR